MTIIKLTDGTTINKMIKIMLSIMLCIGVLCGMNTVAFAADTYMLSGVNVGDVFTTGDVIQNDNGAFLLVYYDGDNDRGGTGTEFEGVEMLVGSGSFPVSQNSSVESPYWKISEIGENGFQYGDAPSIYIILIPTDEKPYEEEIVEVVQTHAKYICNHDFEWMVAYDATAINDGQMMNVCKYCGHAESTAVITAYSKFLEETVNSIIKAPAGSIIDVDTKLWLSFSQDVAIALQKNPNVTVNIKFIFDGYRFQITIPAGYDLMSKINHDGFVGFAYLATDPAVQLQWIP